MKKKLLSIFLSLSLIFSSIASISVAFAEEPELEKISTEKVVQQDGIEVKMDMKAGSSFNIRYTMGQYKTEQYFDNGSKMKDDDYNGWQIMKIVIDIPKNNSISDIKIEPLQNEDGVPENIKKEDPGYFGLKEYDDKYLYNFYFLENGIYKFDIYYKLNGKENKITVDYEAKDLLEMNLALRIRLLQRAFLNGPKEEKYLTKTLLGDESKWFQGIDIGDSDGDIKKVADKITSLNGIQYMGNNLRQLELSWYDQYTPNEKGFINLEKDGIKPVSLGYYPNLTLFRVSETGKLKPYIPTDSYSPELIAECVKKMPNLIEFTCSGSGFKDFTSFKTLNNLNLVQAHLNGIESLEGIENNTMLGTLGVQRNSISDLTPLIECKDLEYFTGYNQSVEKKDPVLATKTENKIRIELPIPIDIDGNLTEVGKIVPPNTSVTEKNIVKATYNSKDINYTAFEENGKIYIELNKSDFDNKAEEVLEDINFKFNFHNCNGKDYRTKDKFNGVVNFKASFNSPVEKKYKDIYSFISGTRGMSLPPKVTDLIPEQEKDKFYLAGETIPAILPEKTVVTVEDGVWTFKGYDDSEKIANDENANEKGEISFTGKWVFEKKVEKETVLYEAKNTSENNDDGDKDDNILDVENIDVLKYIDLPEDKNEYNVGEKLIPENPKVYIKIDENGKEIGKNEYLKKGESTLAEYVEPNKKIKTYVRLTFEGYEPEELEVKAGEENKFIGKFKLEDMEEINYQLKTDKGEDIPDKIKEEFKKIKEHEICSDGKVIKPDMPEHTKISDSNGTWIFKGWIHKDGEKYAYLPEEGVEVHNDDEFIGVWHFEPKNTGGGTVTPTPNPTPNPEPTPNPNPEEPDRIEGNDRIETSIEASKDLYPNGTNTVVLANAERFSDVLTANPFAIQEKASALLTYKDKLPEKTLKEIERLGAKKIYISGGYEAVSKKIVDELAAKGYEIYRFDGVDRYDTARKIAIKIREKGNTNVVELASGENYPDALCMTSMAVKDHAPILLTKKDSIPEYTKRALAEWDIEKIKIGGLEEAISKEVQNQVERGFEITKGNKDDSNIYEGAKSVYRFGGRDRYETSTIIAANSCPDSKLGVYATGEDFPDALIAGNYAGRKKAPVLLVKRDTLPEVVEKYTIDSKIEKATVFGGVNAVSDKVFDLIKAAINK